MKALRPLGCAALTLGLMASCQMAGVEYVGFTPPPASDAPSDAEGTTVVGHIHGTCWGVYLFSALPLITGAANSDGAPGSRLLRDSVEIRTSVRIVEGEARRRGATHLIDLQSDTFSAWSAQTLFFWILEAESSATAIRVHGPPPPGAIPISAPRRRS